MECGGESLRSGVIMPRELPQRAVKKTVLFATGLASRYQCLRRGGYGLPVDALQIAGQLG